jgi:hypothetical protein
MSNVGNRSWDQIHARWANWANLVYFVAYAVDLMSTQDVWEVLID